MQLGEEYIMGILVAVLVVIVASLFIFLMAYRKLTKLNRHIEEMLPQGGGLEQLVDRYLSTIAQVQEAQSRLGERLAALEKWSETAVTKVGLVRYNAFPGVGGDQSFSVALLKGNGEGMVISGIYGRDETRVYAKPIKDGQSTYPLSEEEASVVSAVDGVK